MTSLSRIAKVFLLTVVSIVTAAVAIVVGWWLMQILREEEESDEAVRIPSQRPADINIPLPPQPVDESDVESPALTTEAGSQPADDLSTIDGIGPKYAQGLVQLGVTSFKQLSQQDPDELAAQLKKLGLRIIGDRIRSEDWIGQAQKLASLEGQAR
jgi:predicted flap endonuclease-1-like 5' DNA nuclease